ncbi:hypothetical protein COB55_04295 [Candidatus Wolfebacteria bacterium]|nr:MAG: hypothetical protein COB55_04295 [Candidatus Wolfebacteria bacterium]
MSNVQFSDEYGYRQSSVGATTGRPQMVTWLMNAGIVKNMKQANIVLISIAIFASSLSFYIVSSRIGDPPPPDFSNFPGLEEDLFY